MNRGNVDSSGDREVTTRGAYIANKRNVANITHIYRDGSLRNFAPRSSYSLISSAVNNAIYFGIDTSLTDSGPFSNLIFDIGTPMIYPTTAATVWEYWDGGAWSSWTISDTTDDGDGSFTIGGIGSIAWSHPGDWATTAVNSVTGYWIRMRVTNVGTGITPPTQQNRQIYTTTWPYIEVQTDEIGGDIFAKSKLNIISSGGNIGFSADGVLIGSRLVKRGTNFTPCINMAQSQNPDNITVALAGTGAWSADILSSPVAEVISIGAVSIAEIATITISTPLSSEYVGKFRAFLRFDIGGTSPASSADIQLRYRTGAGGAVTLNTATVALGSTVSLPHQLVDLGIVNIGSLAGAVDEIVFSIYAGVGPTAGISIESLWLMPVDEWSADINDVARAGDGQLDLGRKLTIDNISSNKNPVYYLSDSGAIVSIYRGVLNAPPSIVNNSNVRLYFLFKGATVSVFEDLFLISIDKTQRYLSMRGND